MSLLQSENVADFLDFDIRSLAYPRVQGRHLALVLVKLLKHLNANVPLLGAPPDPRRKAQMVCRRARSEADRGAGGSAARHRQDRQVTVRLSVPLGPLAHCHSFPDGIVWL